MSSATHTYAGPDILCKFSLNTYSISGPFLLHVSSPLLYFVYFNGRSTLFVHDCVCIGIMRRRGKDAVRVTENSLFLFLLRPISKLKLTAKKIKIKK